MARRSPGAVRARLPRRSRRYRYTIPGLSPSVHRQIQDVELDAGLSLGEMERQLFAMTLESTGGNRARAAELLGVSLRTVRNKVREFGLPPRNNYRNDLANNSNKEQTCP